MTNSTKLGVPYLAQAQATPETSHNIALYMIEALTRGVIAQQNAPPGAPADGDSYIVGTAGSGAWAGKNNLVAIYAGTTWRFIPGFNTAGAQIAIGATHEGMLIYNQALDCVVKWTGAAWVALIQMAAFTVATLPAAATYPRARAAVTDANATLTAGIGTIVAAGGANIVPVFSDGTNWRIG